VQVAVTAVIIALWHHDGWPAEAVVGVVLVLPGR
jgi:hypothetical protein